jgi:hypothetical protein
MMGAISGTETAFPFGQTLSHNVVSSTPRHERGSNSQFYL